MYQERQFPQGVLSMFGENAINPNAGLEETAAIATRINTPENLQKMITDPESVIRNKKFSDGTNFSLLHPTGPYTDRAVMVGVYNPNTFEDRESHFIYDYPQEVQREYWQTVFLGLHASRQILAEEGRSEAEAVWGENSTHVSDMNQRTSRTVRFPHGHFIEIDTGRIRSTTHVLHHMEEEQDVLRREVLVERFGARVIQRMQDYMDNALQTFWVRKSPPYGYQFSLPADVKAQNINLLTGFMRSHHSALREVSNHYQRKAKEIQIKLDLSPEFGEKIGKVKKPPSYRTYILINGEDLEIIISPEFWSHGGVLEAMRINLDRSSSHPLVVSREEKRVHGEKFAEIIERERAKAEQD